jgi:hypothetical protein
MRTSPSPRRSGIPACSACILPSMDVSAPYPGLPAPNLLARPILLGLCRRALSPGADPAQAALTARRIEHARAAQTELLKRISALKADTGISQDKALSAQRSAQQAQLDLRLFEERNPVPPPQRTLFKSRAGLEPPETAQQRQRLQLLAQQAQQDAAAAQARAEAVSRELLLAESELGASRKEREGYELTLRDEAGAWIMEQVAAGQGEGARRTLADLRRNVRGDLVVGALLVLTELFCEGRQAARQALADNAPIFEQHRDPAARVLELWTALVVAGAAEDPAQAMLALRLSDAGLFLREQFTQPGLYRLYVLARILSGLGYDAGAVAGDPLRETYAALDAQRGAAGPRADDALPSDAFLRLLAVNQLVAAGRCAAVLALPGFDALAWTPPKRRREAAPELWPVVAALPLSSWPLAQQAGVQSALACHILLAAQAAAHPQLAAAWLEQSYGWPKDDFFWWTLATLQNDAGLMRNFRGEPGQLFRIGRT